MAGHVMYTGGIVRDGLRLYIDAGRRNSYPRQGTSIIDLVNNSIHTVSGTFTTEDGSTIRLFNNTGAPISNTSHIQLSTISNITTVSLWYYQHSTSGGLSRYLLDMRNGGAGGWVYAGGIGTNWSSGTLYVNGGSAQSVLWNNIEALNQWRNITLIANTPATDDMNLFSRFSDNEGLDVTFGVCLVYDKVLTQSENTQNFNALRGRYGI